MKTRYFIVPPDTEQDGVVVLEGPEFHHSMRVSRVRPDEVVHLLDGRGGVYRARVERIEVGRAILRVISFERKRGVPPVDIAVGVIKAPRLESAVEKCTELGARAIIPFVSQRCVRHGGRDGEALKIERMRRKAIAACKQSGQAFIPAIEDAGDIERLAERAASYGLVFLADPEGADVSFPGGFEEDVLGIVGPEGGLTAGERDRLVRAGAVPVSLGPSRLRTETAATCLLYRLLSDYPARGGP